MIKPEAVDPEDTETLADLILAAVRDATNPKPGPGVVQAGPAGRWARRLACPSERNREHVRGSGSGSDRRTRPTARDRAEGAQLGSPSSLPSRRTCSGWRPLKLVKDTVKFCETCFNVAEASQCRICRDPRRDQTILCVVEEPKDVVAVERTREFRGRYHVLGGAISPIDGVGPADLKIRELCLRLADGTVTEVILATDPNLEGEATATYLSRLLVPLGEVSRLASGLPVGGDLEYADEVTLGRAFEVAAMLTPRSDERNDSHAPFKIRCTANVSSSGITSLSVRPSSRHSVTSMSSWE